MDSDIPTMRMRNDDPKRVFYRIARELESKKQLELSCLSSAIKTTLHAVGRLEKEEYLRIDKMTTNFLSGDGKPPAVQLVILVSSRGKEVPNPLIPAPTEAALAHKGLKAIVKEGGKRGVEIEGAGDMGGLQFFCTKVEKPSDSVDMLIESMRAMNALSDPEAEERKGGSRNIGKMICSEGNKGVPVVAYVPEHQTRKVKADQWLKAVVDKVRPGAEVTGNRQHAYAFLEQDKEGGFFNIKMQDGIIAEAQGFLKPLGLFPDADDESSEMVFGDDFDADDY
jgi:hypothetical protein